MQMAVHQAVEEAKGFSQLAAIALETSGLVKLQLQVWKTDFVSARTKEGEGELETRRDQRERERERERERAGGMCGESEDQRAIAEKRKTCIVYAEACLWCEVSSGSVTVTGILQVPPLVNHSQTFGLSFGRASQCKVERSMIGVEQNR